MIYDIKKTTSPFTKEPKPTNFFRLKLKLISKSKHINATAKFYFSCTTKLRCKKPTDEIRLRVKEMR